ncbi:hypothetical protein OG898_19705 [Streptomyces sp. NBC_00193]|uniref:hypothetical protein n=1 Tax=Streptomyces sp. NBC_00193 TaxID=2975675 RepID=UPI00225A2EE3|nr:hypothetical protein [Streptomyces sp. NBC_00193]MCX5298682.1 hypothetical protein [Streptomyces sp. NBC_00193]
MYVEIVLGPLPVRYYPRSGALGKEDLLPGQDEGREQSLVRSDRLRRIVMPLPSGRSYRLFLHWSDGTDLEDLDRRIAEGESCEGAFAGALAGGDMDLRCRTCGTDFLAVVADAGTPLLGDIANRLRAHEFVDVCPVCGAGWQPHVMHAVEAA